MQARGQARGGVGVTFLCVSLTHTPHLPYAQALSRILTLSLARSFSRETFLCSQPTSPVAGLPARERFLDRPTHGLNPLCHPDNLVDRPRAMGP